MKKLLWLLLLLLVCTTVLYFSGPHPKAPDLQKKYTFDLPTNASGLESYISQKESKIQGLKPDNQARIVWNDTSTKAKTSVAFLYIHGFSASQEEGDPVHTDIAKHFKSNLYLARIAEHGTERGDSTMVNLTADALIESAEEALAITKQLGNEVVVIGTSMGGALTTYLASRHPEIKAIVLYSPCIAIYDPTATLLDNPWGLQTARIVKSSEFNDIIPKNETQPKYWNMHYRLEAVVALQNFLTHCMVSKTFEKVKCPVFMGYYYENEEKQDKVVSVPAMLNMFAELGTPADKKVKEAFPTAQNHVLGSYVLSEDWKSVENSTLKFLDKVL